MEWYRISPDKPEFTYRELHANGHRAFVEWFAWFPLSICPGIVRWRCQAVRRPDDENNTRSSSIKRNKKNAKSRSMMRNSYSGWICRNWMCIRQQFFFLGDRRRKNMNRIVHIWKFSFWDLRGNQSEWIFIMPSIEILYFFSLKSYFNHLIKVTPKIENWNWISKNTKRKCGAKWIKITHQLTTISIQTNCDVIQNETNKNKPRIGNETKMKIWNVWTLFNVLNRTKIM